MHAKDPATSIGIIDTLIGFPVKDERAAFSYLSQQIKDRASEEELRTPIEYLFNDIPGETTATRAPST